MVRYTQRPWYSPLGFMAHTPHSYGFFIGTLGFYLVYPFRYRYSDWSERMMPTKGQELQDKAVLYYRELERMQRRMAMFHNPVLQGFTDSHVASAAASSDSLNYGVTDFEYQYWHAHQRDAMRAEKLLAEVDELQRKIAVTKTA